ncbi:MAG: APC family permease [Thermoplasma acidophilum]|nr:APC family permease [Thermoplasma acidophilum]
MRSTIPGSFGPFVQSLSSIGPMLNIIGLFSIIAAIDYRDLFYIVLVAFAFSAFNIYMPYRASSLIRSNGGYYAVTGLMSGKRAGVATAYLYLIYGFSALPSITLFLMSFASFFMNSFYVEMLIPVFYTSIALYAVSRGVGRSIDIMKALGIIEVAFIVVLDWFMLVHPEGYVPGPNKINFTGGSLWSGLLFGMLMFSGAGSAFFITENTNDGRKRVPLGILTAFLVSGILMSLSAYAVQSFLGERMISYSLNPYIIVDYIRSSAGSIVYYAFIFFSVSSAFNLTIGYLNSFRNAAVRMSLDNIFDMDMRRFYALIFAVNLAISWGFYLTLGVFSGFIIVSGIVSSMYLTVHLISTASLSRHEISFRKRRSIAILSVSFAILAVTLVYSIIADATSDIMIDLIYLASVILVSISILFHFRGKAMEWVKFGGDEA